MPGNPFIKTLSGGELGELLRKRSYVNRLYDEETNMVNYHELIQRLKNTSLPLLPQEYEVIRQVQRNLGREHWMTTAPKYPIKHNGHTFFVPRDVPRGDGVATAGRQRGGIHDPYASFDNFRGGTIVSTNERSVPPTILGQYWPESYLSIGQPAPMPFTPSGVFFIKGPPNLRHPERDFYDLNFDLRSQYAKQGRSIFGLSSDVEERNRRRVQESQKMYGAYGERGAEQQKAGILEDLYDQIDRAFKYLDEAPKRAKEAEEARQRAEQERIRRDLESQISSLNYRYESSQADNRRKLEDQQRLFKQTRAEDFAKYQKELEAFKARSADEISAVAKQRDETMQKAREFELARDEAEKRLLAYQTVNDQRMSEFKANLLASQEESIKKEAETSLRLKELKETLDKNHIAAEAAMAKQAEEHKMELANLQGKLSVAAQTLEAERNEKARMKKQSELFMRNVLRRRNMRNAGSLNWHFLGEGQPDSPYRSNELLFIGDNRYVPSMTQLNTMGRAIRTDTAVPDIFQSMLRQNRPNQQRRR